MTRIMMFDEIYLFHSSLNPSYSRSANWFRSVSYNNSCLLCRRNSRFLYVMRNISRKMDHIELEFTFVSFIMVQLKDPAKSSSNQEECLKHSVSHNSTFGYFRILNICTVQYFMDTDLFSMFFAIWFYINSKCQIWVSAISRGPTYQVCTIAYIHMHKYIFISNVVLPRCRSIYDLTEHYYGSWWFTNSHF